MKVLYIINNLAPAGAEILQALIASEIKRRGVDAEIATLYKYANKAVYKRAIAEGIMVHSLDFTWRYDPRICGAIRRLCRQTNYDVVHVNLFPAQYMVALARPACGKLVLSEHSATNHRIGRAVFRPVEYFIYGRFDPIVCVAENVYKKLSSWLPGLSKRMTVVLNGIDLVRFSSAAPIDTKQFGVPAGAPVCVMVARFYPPKDQKTLINAAALIPGLHVLLAGEGDLEQAMRDHAARKGVADRVHFLGYRDDIHALVKACDVYVYSSHFEGMPLAVAEAMACGAPVVGSNVDGVNEIVQDKKSGLLFESGNEKDLAEKIGVVLRDAGVRAALRSGSLARSKDFSLDTMVTRLLSLYSA